MDNSTIVISAIKNKTPSMDWLKKHVIELMLGAIFSVIAFDHLKLQAIDNRLVRVETRVDHIDSAVNNSAPGDPTLKEMVVTIMENTKKSSGPN